MKAIRFLKRNEIDEQKWNALINQSKYSLLYPFIWYLDVVAENWDALVVGDYETVLPLVWLRKLGVKCLYQPFFCQQLGFFSSKNLDKTTAGECLTLVKGKYPYVDMNLNPSAEIVGDDFSLKKKKNLLLRLDKEYVQLKKGYTENQKRNIAKASNAELVIAKCDDGDFADFYIKQIQLRQPSFKGKHASLFRELVSEVVKRKMGEIAVVKNKDGEVIAGTLLLIHQKRIINIAQVSSSGGRNSGAAHFLFDHIIQKNAGSDKVLDFEGSSIASIARFYEGFGAKPEEFYHFKTHILKRSGPKA